MRSFWFLVMYLVSYFFKCDCSFVCEFATRNKYLGSFFVISGSGNVDPYNSSIINDPEICKLKCRIDERCYAASFDGIQTCMFYNTSNIIVDSNDVKTYFLWKICDWTLATEPLDGRCKGSFVRYYNTTIIVTNDYQTLKVIENRTDISCQTSCALFPLCEVITYNNSNSNCSLYQLWPHEFVKETTEPNVDLYKWTCVPDFVESLHLPKTKSQPNPRKCTGYWNITSRNVTLPNINSPGVYFHTQSFKVCLSECNAHEECKYALFNVSRSMCLLPYTESSKPYPYLQTLTFISFEWICLVNNSVLPQMNDNERRYIKMGFECVTLINNTDAYIAEDNCGNIPTMNKFVNCNSRNTMKNWTITDSCLVNQSFWKFPTSIHNMSISGISVKRVSKIFTGLTSFWIAHSINETFKIANFLECRRFNGAKASKSIREGDIIKRSRWYAYNPQGYVPIIENRPTYIIISSSHAPNYGCRTIEACTSILRRLQIYYFNGEGTTMHYVDIPYNFMLDENGNIYEARGFGNKCEAAYAFNDKSFCFGFIGMFKDFYPSIEFLESLKKLINFAVEKKYVADNYILIIHQDATRFSIYRNFEIIIKDWYRYRGFIPEDCSNISSSILSINIALIILSAIVMFLCHRLFRNTIRCKKCEFLYLIRLKMINRNEDRAYSSLIQERCLDTKCCLVTAKEGPLSMGGKSEFNKFLKVWFLNRSLKTVNSKHLDYDLASYLSFFRSSAKGVHLYDAYLEKDRGNIRENVYIVLCCTDPETYKRFSGLSESNVCICRYFSINFMSFSKPLIEIVGESVL